VYVRTFHVHMCMLIVDKNLLADQGLYHKKVAVSGKYGRGSTSLGELAKKIISAFLCFQHVIEKEELKLHLQASKDAQRQLTAEVLKAFVGGWVDGWMDGWASKENTRGKKTK